MAFKKINLSRGFSLIEMMISIAIIAIIFAVILFNQGDFIDRFSLATNAGDLELQIRQSQVYGVAVKEFSPSGSEFSAAYGISVSRVSTGDETFYISFADRGAQNGWYDGGPTCVVGGSSECIMRVNLTRGVVISRICALKTNGSQECAPIVGRVDISFIRPDPAARIQFFNPAGQPIGISDREGVLIEFLSPLGNKREIRVYTTGQISLI